MATSSSSLGSTFFISGTPCCHFLMLYFGTCSSQKAKEGLWLRICDWSQQSPSRLGIWRTFLLSWWIIVPVFHVQEISTVHRENPETISSVWSRGHWQFHCHPGSCTDLCNFIFWLLVNVYISVITSLNVQIQVASALFSFHVFKYEWLGWLRHEKQKDLET